MVLWAALLFCDYLSFIRLLWLRFVVLVAGWVGVFAPFFLVFCLCCFGFGFACLISIPSSFLSTYLLLTVSYQDRI
jgi:hypothetical protein